MKKIKKIVTLFEYPWVLKIKKIGEKVGWKSSEGIDLYICKEKST